MSDAPAPETTKQRAQQMLFGDPLPDLDVETGYRGPIACKAAGITYRQLDYWDRTGLVSPTIRTAAGSGSQRLYSFRDILVLKVVKRLLDTGVSLQQIRLAVSQLAEYGVDDLAQITLMSDGASVYECTSDDQVIDLAARSIIEPAEQIAQLPVLLRGGGRGGHVEPLDNLNEEIESQLPGDGPLVAIRRDVGRVGADLVPLGGLIGDGQRAVIGAPRRQRQGPRAFAQNDVVAIAEYIASLK